MTEFLANSIFFGAIAAFSFFIYQCAVLPGIRQVLRFEVFKLRDDLRNLVIKGVLEEDDDAFLLLHENLNFMASNIPRFDLASAVTLLKNLDEERREKVQASLKIIESGPAQVQSIYKESVLVFTKALILNSLALFVFLTVPVIFATVIKTGFKRAVDALRMKAAEDSTVAFFSATQVAV